MKRTPEPVAFIAGPFDGARGEWRGAPGEPPERVWLSRDTARVFRPSTKPVDGAAMYELAGRFGGEHRYVWGNYRPEAGRIDQDRKKVGA